MTQDEKRIKLAEAGGLKVIDVPFIPSQTKSAGCVFTDAARTAWRKCYPNSCGVHGIPDYFNDLNAVHELENIIKDHPKWVKMLAKVIAGVPHASRAGGTKVFVDNSILARATAAERCEALGLTLNLWK